MDTPEHGKHRAKVDMIASRIRRRIDFDGYVDIDSIAHAVIDHLNSVHTIDTDHPEGIIYKACENLEDLEISQLVCLARNQEEVIRSLNVELKRLSNIRDRIPRSYKNGTCCTGKCLLPVIYRELYGDIE